MKLKRVLSIAAKVALGALALLILTLAGGALWIQSDSGQRFVRVKTEKLLGDTLAGTLTFRDLRVRFDGRIHLMGVSLLDPKGASVLTVEEAQIRLSPRSLLKRRIATSLLALEGVELALRQETDGSWNLVRALTPKNPPSPEDGAQPWVIDLDGVALTHANVLISRPQQDEFRARVLKLAASTTIEGEKLELELEEGKLELQAPLARAVELAVSLHKDAEGIRIPRATLRSEESSLEATAVINTLTDGSLGSVEAVLRSLEIGRADLKRYAQLDAKEPWTATASFIGPAEAIQSEIGLDTRGAGSLRLNAVLSAVKGKESVKGTLALKDIKLERLGHPSLATTTTFDANVKLTARGIPLQEASVSLQVPQGQVAGHKIQVAQARINYTPDRIDLHELKVVVDSLLRAHAKASATRMHEAWLPELEARVEGTLAPATHAPGSVQKPSARHYRVDATARERALSLAAHLNQPGAGLQENTDLTVQASLSQDLARATLTKLELRALRQHWRQLGRPAVLIFKPELSLSPLVLGNGKGRLAMAGALNAKEQLHATVDVTNFDLQLIPFGLFTPGLDLRGTVDARLRARGPAAAPEADGNIKINLEGASFARADTAMELQAAVLDTVFAWRTRKLEIRTKGALEGIPLTLEADIGRGLLDAPGACRRSCREISLSSALGKVPLEKLQRWTGLNAELTEGLPRKGTLAVALRAEGQSLEGVVGSIRLNADGIVWKQWNSLSGQVDLTSAKVGGMALRANLSEADKRLFNLDGSWRPAAGGTALPQSVEAFGAGTLDLKAVFEQLPLKNFAKADANAAANAGVVWGTLDLHGPLQAPRAEVVLTARELPQSAQLDLKAQYGKELLTTLLIASAPGLNSARMNARIPIDLGFNALRAGPAPQRDAPLEAKLTLQILELSVFQSLMPGVSSIRGALSGDVAVNGTLAQPRVRGNIALRNTDLVLENGNSFQRMEAALALTDETLHLERFSFSGGGNVSATALVRNYLTPKNEFEATLKTRDFIVEPARYPSATLTTDLRMKGSLDPQKLDATVNVDSLRFWLPELASGKPVQSLAMHPDIKVLDPALRSPRLVARARKQAQAEEKAGAAPARQVNITLDAPRNLWIQGPDILLELGSHISARSDAKGILLTGDVHQVSDRGEVTVLGRKFDIQTLLVEFQKTEPAKGELQIDATHTARDTKVAVALRGQLVAPKLSVSSDPPLSEPEIMALLMTGKTPDTAETAAGGEASVGERATSAAANAITQYVATRVESFADRRTPLVVNVDVESAAEKKGSVEVGRYLSPKFYVSYERQFGAEEGENSNVVHGEYQLGRRWTVDGYYGDAQSGGLDLLWKKRF